MPGLQLASFWEGNRAELFATYVLSGIASVASVPHQFDVGIDLLCTLMRRDGNSMYAGRSFGVQVRLGAREFRYGGLTDRGKWKKHELKWLFSQDVPLLFGVVDLNKWHFRLYSPTRIILNAPTPARLSWCRIWSRKVECPVISRGNYARLMPETLATDIATAFRLGNQS